MATLTLDRRPGLSARAAMPEDTMAPSITTVAGRTTHLELNGTALTALVDQFIADNVPTKAVQVDYTYARALTHARMRKLDLMVWDHRKAGTLLVSMRNDGMFAIIDGQGRLYLALKAKVDTVPARVYIDLTLEQEAQLYLAFNRDRVATKPVDDFTAKLVANDPQAIAIRDMLGEMGLHVERKYGPNSIAAISTVEDMYGRHGYTLTKAAIGLLHQIWPDDSAALTNDLLRGMMAFMLRYMHLFSNASAAADLRKRLEAVSPARLKGLAAQRRDLSPGMSADNAIGQSIVQVYDKGRKIRLPAWPAVVYSAVAKEGKPAAAIKGAATRRAMKAKAK